MDSLFNIVIILIPLAIIIGRAVTSARAKHQPPPPAPHIPVHFEDEDDESVMEVGHWVSDYVKEASVAPAVPAPAAGGLKSYALKHQKTKTLASPGVIEPLPTGDRVFKSPKTELPQQTAAPPAALRPGLTNLNNLSPLKQAVVMAEVLGPPKALQPERF